MKDVRCMLGMHRWAKRQVEDSQYVLCTRCGRDRQTNAAGPMGGRPGY
jgi:Prophage protein (DUF1660)